MTRILTADFGTTATKAVLWDDTGLVAVGSAPVATAHPRPGWAEQDPAAWWESLAIAIAQLPPCASLDAVGLCGARETFVALTDDLVPLGPGVLWADRRGASEAENLLAVHGGREAVRQRIGLVLDGSLMVAKVTWLAAHDAALLAAARWLLCPRDWIAARLTGVVATDPTMASKTGFYSVSGDLVAELAAPAGNRLPPPTPSASIVGPLLPGPAVELGLPPGTPVVAGAGDRACEVLGTDASASTPVVSWGTTANVSVPVAALPDPLPGGRVVTRGALGGWIYEAGLSASGAAMRWLAELTGATDEELYADAAGGEPGARGAVSLPWLNGSRAPWWQPGARAGFVGLTAAHGRGDLARAIIEGVALDVDRSLAAVAPAARSVQATGGGSAGRLWRDILGATGNRTVIVRRLPDAASAGACLLAAAAIGADLNLDRLNPIVAEEAPDPGLVAGYAALREQADRAAAAVVALDFGE